MTHSTVYSIQMTQQTKQEDKMILLSKTFETWTHEDIEIGETDDRGFMFEDKEFTFFGLINELDSYTQTSSYPADSSCWISTEGDMDMVTGERTTYSLHFNGPENKRKYWEKALRWKGLIT